VHVPAVRAKVSTYVPKKLSAWDRSLEITEPAAEWLEYRLRQVGHGPNSPWWQVGRIGDWTGVYVIYNPVDGTLKPAYIGMSENLGRRLGDYANGRTHSHVNPVDVVVAEALRDLTDENREAYKTMPAAEQQAWRKYWMEERNLLVRVALVDTKEHAQMLEQLMIRSFEAADIELWNKLKYKSTFPFKAYAKETP
jgi:predicted GIY-YIG superfamily endonuclease